MRYLVYFLCLTLFLASSCGNEKNDHKVLIINQGSASDTISIEDVALLKRIASFRNDLIHVGQMQMEEVTLADQKKTTGIISELLDRAEQKILGELPSGRFSWSWAGFEEPEGMVDMAEGFLKELASGVDPLEGKFAEPGGNVVDHAIIKKDNLWHLIYIRGIAGSSWPDYPQFNFGHAVSSDLVNWQIEKPLLETVKEEFDSYQVWAPHIIEHEGKYWNFYTGVNDSVTQAICLATSEDLYQWERYEDNPLFNSLPWGFWDESHWSDCRDPMVLKEGDTFYCYYTAGRMIPDTEQFEYCLGIASSKDLLSWKDEGFRRLEHTLGTPPESPFVVKKDGEFYLFYTNYTHGIVYVKSSDPLHWEENPDNPQSIIKGVSASEIIEENGKWYISYISHMNNGLHFFEIKELLWNSDGSVQVQDAHL